MITPLRPILLKPPIDEIRLADVVAIVKIVYRRHERGLSYESELAQLNELTGKQLGYRDICGAFGSVNEETYAHDVLSDTIAYPNDLSQAELLTLLELVMNAEGEDWQYQYWLDLVELNTGCANLSDLIFYPEEYFGPDAPDHDLSAEEILAEATSNHPRRLKPVLRTPPPAGAA